jgi:hypothetical protein
MYDVIYIDAKGVETPLAQQFRDRDGACAFARQAAAERGAGRAMLPGSTNLRDCVCIVPATSLSSAA